MPRRILGLFAAIVLQVVALVLAHDLVYLARFGSRYGEALVHSGHGDAWSGTVTTTLVVAFTLVLAGAARLAYLGILVRHAPGAQAASGRVARRSGSLDVRLLRGLWLGIGVRTALVSVVLLTIQENLERAVLTGTMPGIGILVSPEYPAAVLITVAVGLFVGFVAALFEWRRRTLTERLHRARGGLPRRVASVAPRPGAIRERLASSVLGRRSGLRAPPLPSGS